MNEIIKQGIDSASLALAYWGAEKENILNFNRNIAISQEHELSLVNCEEAITAAQALLDEQVKIAEKLAADNKLIKADYEKYLEWLQTTYTTLQELYDKYPNPFLKVSIDTLGRIITVIKTIIRIFN